MPRGPIGVLIAGGCTTASTMSRAARWEEGDAARSPATWPRWDPWVARGAVGYGTAPGSAGREGAGRVSSTIVWDVLIVGPVESCGTSVGRDQPARGEVVRVD